MIPLENGLRVSKIIVSLLLWEDFIDALLELRARLVKPNLVFVDLRKVSKLTDGRLQSHFDRFSGVPHVMNYHIQKQLTPMSLRFQVLHLSLQLRDDSLILKKVIVWVGIIKGELVHHVEALWGHVAPPFSWICRVDGVVVLISYWFSWIWFLQDPIFVLLANIIWFFRLGII